MAGFLPLQAAQGLKLQAVCWAVVVAAAFPLVAPPLRPSAAICSPFLPFLVGCWRAMRKGFSPALPPHPLRPLPPVPVPPARQRLLLRRLTREVARLGGRRRGIFPTAPLPTCVGVPSWGCVAVVYAPAACARCYLSIQACRQLTPLPLCPHWLHPRGPLGSARIEAGAWGGGAAIVAPRAAAGQLLQPFARRLACFMGFEAAWQLQQLPCGSAAHCTFLARQLALLQQRRRQTRPMALRCSPLSRKGSAPPLRQCCCCGGLSAQLRCPHWRRCLVLRRPLGSWPPYCQH